MKKIIFSILLVIQFIPIIAQNSPVTFEDGGIGSLWTWTVFENDIQPPLEIVSNPNPSGLNLSNKVAKFTAMQNGMPWAGCETQHGSDIGTFTLNATNCVVKMMVYKPIISNVGIKYATASGASTGEILVPNTLINQWEELTFDFSNVVGLPATTNVDQLIIFPDFATRNTDHICYFDNIKFQTQGPPLAEPLTAAPDPTFSAQNVISMFSNPYTNVQVDTWQTPWSQGTLTDIQINGNDTKLYNNLNFVGIETTGNNILDVSGMSHLYFNAWTANMTSLKVKLVDFGADLAYAGGDDSEHELTFTPVLENWNTYDIPLSNFTTLNSNQHIAQLIFASTPIGEGVVYIDNVLFHTNEAGVIIQEESPFTLYPNPSKDIFILKGNEKPNKLQLYDQFGRLLQSFTPQGIETTISISNMEDGIYYLTIETEKGFKERKSLNKN